MRAESIGVATDTDVHAIILTFNEQLHIERCIRSIIPLCRSILVVDSGSTDGTVEIARSLGADVVSNPFHNYATQENFGIEHLAGRGGWLLRIDADEYLVGDAAYHIRKALADADDETAGVFIRRRIHFMGRWIRHGGIYPIWTLRLWRNGRGMCEQRWMDEHIIVSGQVKYVAVDIADENLKPVGWWTDKHNQYASRETIDILSGRYALNVTTSVQPRELNGPIGRKRWLKDRVYNHLPMMIRPFLYFVLRYIFLLGFLDGRAGYFFHVLQGFWYRTLVDAKIAEIERRVAEDPSRRREIIKQCTNIDI